MGLTIIFILPNNIKDVIKVFFGVAKPANKLIIKARHLTTITVSFGFFTLFDVIV